MSQAIITKLYEIWTRLGDGNAKVQIDQTTPGTTNAVSLTGSNEQIYDGTAVWADSAAANTEVDIDITLPSPLQGESLYLVAITNPSAITALTVVVKNKETLDVARYPELTRFGVAASTSEGKAVLVQGWILGEAGRLTLSNDTVLGAGEGFTAYVRVRKV